MASDNDPVLTCDVCGAAMQRKLADYLFQCPECALWRSTLRVNLRDPAAGRLTGSRSTSFNELRHRNGCGILERLAGLIKLDGKSLLDVGCAQGWFLEMARARGMRVVGIEAEQGVAAEGRARGLPILDGVFPQALAAAQKFDVVCFHDVFEHLPAPGIMLDTTLNYLQPGGLLVMSLPMSDGFIFRTACTLRLHKILRRLWQADFYSPHLYYFNAANLQRLATQKSLRLLHAERLLTLSHRGLWARIALTGDSLLRRLGVYIVAKSAAPMLNHVLPNDTSVFMFQAPQ